MLAVWVIPSVNANLTLLCTVPTIEGSASTVDRFLTISVSHFTQPLRLMMSDNVLLVTVRRRERTSANREPFAAIANQNVFGGAGEWELHQQKHIKAIYGTLILSIPYIIFGFKFFNIFNARQRDMAVSLLNRINNKKKTRTSRLYMCITLCMNICWAGWSAPAPSCRVCCVRPCTWPVVVSNVPIFSFLIMSAALKQGE